jgi:hypothetical protein
VPVGEPIHIIVLDQLSTITGFDDATESGIYSNEVHNLATEKLTVKAHKGGELAEGLYQDIKGVGKFTKSVYACLIKGGELELVNFKFSGSSLSPWIDAKVGDDGCVIELKSNDVELKKGTNTYYAPTITRKVVRQDILEKAMKIDDELQTYFRAKPVDRTDVKFVDGEEVGPIGTMPTPDETDQPPVTKDDPPF